MNVVHVFKDYYPPTTGGVEQHMSLLCRKLARKIQVTVLVPSRSRHRIQETLDGVRIVRVPEFGRYASVPLCPTAHAELRKINPDLVHLHFPNPMGDLAQLWGAPRIPFVLTYHADIIRQKAFLPLYRPILERLFNKVSKVLFSAKENITSASYFSRHRDKSVVIPFGIEVDLFRLSGQEQGEVTDFRCGFDAPIVLFVGAARHYKGIEVLLKSMVSVAGYLLLAGRGTEAPQIKRLASDLGIDSRVRFYGEVTESRLRLLLNAADVFVLPSINGCETFGIGQLEAMACSKPVVSTDLPTGVQSVNQNGITGLVVPPGRDDALASALNTLIANPLLCAEYGGAARRRVEREFGVDRMVARTLEVYGEVLG